jgi:hypothetical protein
MRRGHAEDPKMPDDVRTMFAMQANALALQFNDMFGEVTIPPGYWVDMTAPDGPSTGGGVQTLQHLRLHAPAPGPILLMGSLDSGEMKVTLRTFAYMLRLAQQRRFILNVDPPGYTELVSRIRKLYEALHFIVVIEDVPNVEPIEVRPAPTHTAPMPRIPESPFWLGFAAGGAVFGAAGALLTWLLLRT